MGFATAWLVAAGETAGKVAAKRWPPFIAAGRRRAEDRREQDDGGHHTAGSKGFEHAGFRSRFLSPAWSDTLRVDRGNVGAPTPSSGARPR